MMSQKTILSFFKQSTSSSPKVNDDTEKSSTKPTISDNADKLSTKPNENGDAGNSGTNSNSKKQRKSDSKNSKTDNKVKKSPANKNSKTSCANGISKKSVAIDESDVIDAKKTVKDINSDSPIKQPQKRKRVLIIESDEESDGSEELRGKDNEEMEVDDSSETTNGVESVATNGVGKNSRKPPTKKKQATISRTSVQQAKRKKTAQSGSDEEENPPSEPAKETKLEDDAVEEKSAVKDLPNNHAPTPENNQKEPSTSQSTSDGTAELIPKRKTARKQMRGGQSKKQLLQKAQDSTKTECENEESIASNNVTSSPDKKNETEESEVDVDVGAINGTTENDSESHQNDLQADEEPKKQEKEENVKSKIAIHPFFGTKKKEPETAPSAEKSDKKDIKCSSTTGTSYDPSKNRYHPIDDACWKKGEKVPYLALAKTLELIEDTSARLKIIEILSNYLRSVIVLNPDDLLYSVYLCLNRLAPEYEGIELGIGEMLLMKAVAQATGRTVEKIKAEVNVKGDLGLVAESSRGNQRIMFAPPKLTVFSVFSKFKEIAKMSGNTVMSKKIDKIQALFVACRDCEAKYIIRSLSGKMRIGLAEQSVLAALARAAVLTPPNQAYPPEVIDKSSKMSADSFKEFLIEQTLILKTTYCECPNFDMVIPVLLKEGIAGLPIHCQLCPGCPLKPMLAHPTNGIDEVLNRFDKNEFTCEFKYDGERAQIHMTDKGEIKIFSRNQEDNTSKYPDIISRLPKSLKDTTKSFILDTEAVAWDCETKQILPFQVLSTRKKKDAVESDIVVQVCLMAFDLIYLNGESLVKKPLKERRELLHSSFVEVENKFMFVNYRDGNNADTMQEFLDESIKGNCEGLMVKALKVDASYEIAKRSHNWLKLKKDYLNGVGDTLDLVVIGGYHGKGKRKGTYGGFLLACYDDENEEFQSICKLGTGFSEKELETHTNFFKDHVIPEPKSYYRFDNSLEPDVWFEAVQIWEIKCADLSISPVHKAAIGIVDPEKGISLRFPRFLRIREDKSKPEDATVSSQIAEMYQNQEQVQNTKNKNMKSEEDYY